mgnify:CR=1 FL=1
MLDRSAAAHRSRRLVYRFVGQFPERVHGHAHIESGVFARSRMRSTSGCAGVYPLSTRRAIVRIDTFSIPSLKRASAAERALLPVTQVSSMSSTCRA